MLTLITLEDVMKLLISVSTRHLNAENEMKKRFGSHVVRAENRFVYYWKDSFVLDCFVLLY